MGALKTLGKAYECTPWDHHIVQHTRSNRPFSSSYEFDPSYIRSISSHLVL